MRTKAAALVAFFGVLLGGVMLADQNQAGKPEPKEFLYRVQPTRPEMLRSGPTKEESAAVEEHFNYLKDLTAKGVVILAGRTLNNDESTFGIVVFRAASEEAAREIMNGDPAVRIGCHARCLVSF